MFIFLFLFSLFCDSIVCMDFNKSITSINQILEFNGPLKENHFDEFFYKKKSKNTVCLISDRWTKTIFTFWLKNIIKCCIGIHKKLRNNKIIYTQNSTKIYLWI
jgi:hypothetical protein